MPASGYGLVELQGHYLSSAVREKVKSYSLPKRLPRARLRLDFSYHLACRQVDVTPACRLPYCILLRCL